MNRRQFLSSIPMISAAIVAAPAVAAAMAVKPQFAMGGTLTPCEPYIVGESVRGMIMTPNQVRDMEDSRMLSELEICRIFQVPPHMVGIANAH